MNKLLLSFALFTLLPLNAQAKLAESEKNAGDILIKFKPGTAVMNFSALQNEGGQVEELGDDWVHVEVQPASMSAFGGTQEALLDVVRANPAVEYAQPNYMLHLIEDYEAMNPWLKTHLMEIANLATKFSGGAAVSKPAIPKPRFRSPMHSGADPLFPQQWGLQSVHAEEAWKISEGDKKITVAVIDSGVDYTHDDLTENIWHNPNEIPGNGIDDDGNGYVDDEIGWDFVDKDNKPYDVTTGILRTLFLGGNPGHGTHCAGTIGAVSHNGKGISGLAPNISIMPLRFIGSRGEGTTASAVKAINYAVKNGAKVLSNSWGSEGEDPKEDNKALKDAITNALNHDVLFIAAAGNGHSGKGYDNDTDKKPEVPGSYDIANIMSVAAIDNKKNLGTFSNWGKKTVHIAAPGVSIMSTMSWNRYGENVFKFGPLAVAWEGTSMAAPFVAGAAALVWSAHPEYKALDVKNKLIATADKIPSLAGKVVSDGTLNVGAAIK